MRHTFSFKAVLAAILVAGMAAVCPPHWAMAADASPAPNLFIHASDGFIAAITAEDFDENDAHFSDCIIGTSITGTTHTAGHRGAVLVDCPDRVLLEMRMRGTTMSQTVGVHPPVTIRSAGTTQFTGAMRVAIDADGYFGSVPVASACTHSNIQSICVCSNHRIVQRIATKKVYQAKGEAECIAGQHAAERVKARIKSNADEALASQNQNYQEKFLKPMAKWGAVPDLHYSSTTTALAITASEAGPDSLAAIGTPPELTGNPMMGVRVHETFINNLTAKTLGGRTISRKEFEDAFVKTFGDLPPGNVDDGKEWTITFAKEKPVTVQFADSGYSIEIRATHFTSTNPDVEVNEAWNITAKYKIDFAAHKATRIGDVDIVAPALAGQQLSSKQVAHKRVIHDRFGQQFLKDVIEFQGIEFQKAPFSKAGKLIASQMSADKGWLMIGWEQAK